MNTASPFFSVSHTAAEGLSAMFRAAAWSMDTPAPYSLFHLLLTASGITAAAFLAELFSCKITDCRKVLFPCGLLLAAGLIATVINVLSRPYGNADMFYISPYYPNLQIVFHRISLTIGITFGNICYLLSVITGGAICHRLSGKISSAGRPPNTARLQ